MRQLLFLISLYSFSEFYSGNRLLVDGSEPSGSRESVSGLRRRKRLRIVYLGDTDSSDSDYRPHSR